MNKAYSYSVFILLVVSSFSLHAQMSFYDFTVMDIDGEEYKQAQLRGKKVLVVNTASKCGLTLQYADLEKLYEDIGDDTFMVIGFPSNDFPSQEPGSNAEIKQFCNTKYEI